MTWSSFVHHLTGRGRIEAFERLGDTIANHIDQILITLEHRLSNTLVEALNTRIRSLTRRAFGFHSSRPLIGGGLAGAGRRADRQALKSSQPAA